MKLFKLTLLVGLLLAFVPFVSAYGFYGPSYDSSLYSGSDFSGYGYGYIPSYQNFNVQENSFDRSNVFQSKASGSSQSSSDSFQNSVVDTFVFNEQSTLTSGFGNFANDGQLNLADGYDMTVDKCSTRVVRGHVDGDRFKVTERVCSPVTGRLWKDNSLSTSFQNHQGYDNFATQTGLTQNQYFNEASLAQRSESENVYSQTHDFSEKQTSFGQGAVIILN